MKIYFPFFFLLLLGCQKNATVDKNPASVSGKQNISTASLKDSDSGTEKKFLDSIYHCECSSFASELEEIPGRNTDAYKLTIRSKKGNYKFTKILDTRPEMSQIDYCNDLYTVVGFACGGPCFTRVFVFTDKSRPNEQYGYPREVKNNPNIIAHIKDEEFEKLIIHNFSNSKELTVDISDDIVLPYGQIDSLVFNKDYLSLYYISDKNKKITKRINLKSIL